jgi:hypothetical protein
MPIKKKVKFVLHMIISTFFDNMCKHKYDHSSNFGLLISHPNTF